ncbi:MAG: DNA-binding protein [Candidatus Micrarchaeia archaeon]|jgi:DNA-binding TFAR19-related protein (PDSD5 family)
MKKEEAEEQKIIEQLKIALRQVCEFSAYDRMTNVLMTNPKLFAHASQRIIQYASKTGRKINEREVLVLLSSLREIPKTGQISIKRK